MNSDVAVEAPNARRTLEESIAIITKRFADQKALGCAFDVGGKPCGALDVEDSWDCIKQARTEASPRVGSGEYMTVADVGHAMAALGNKPVGYLCAEHARVTAEKIRAERLAAFAARLSRQDFGIPSGFGWARPWPGGDGYVGDDGAHVSEEQHKRSFAARVQRGAAVAATERVGDLVTGKARVVTLAGDAGTGKTGLAVFLLRYLQKLALANGITSREAHIVCGAKFANAQDLTPEGESRDGRFGASDADDLYQTLFNAPLVVLDDVGQEKRGGEAFKDLVSKLVFGRFQRIGAAPLPTIITTGLTQEAIEARYGGGFARRIMTDENLVRVVQFAPKRATQ